MLHELNAGLYGFSRNTQRDVGAPQLSDQAHEIRHVTFVWLVNHLSWYLCLSLVWTYIYIKFAKKNEITEEISQLLKYLVLKHEDLDYMCVCVYTYTCI